MFLSQRAVKTVSSFKFQADGKKTKANIAESSDIYIGHSLSHIFNHGLPALDSQATKTYHQAPYSYKPGASSLLFSNVSIFCTMFVPFATYLMFWFMNTSTSYKLYKKKQVSNFKLTLLCASHCHNTLAQVLCAICDFGDR